MKKLVAVLCLAVLLLLVLVWLRRPSVQPSPATRSVATSPAPPMPPAGDDLVSLLKQENARLRQELQAARAPKTTASTRFLWFDGRTGLLQEEARAALGLTPQQFKQGNQLIAQTVAALRKLEATHMENPVMSGDVMLVKIGTYQTETDQLIDQLYGELEAVWSKEIVDQLRGQKRNRIFAGVGAGYVDKVVTIRPSTFRPGYLEVLEDAEQVDGRTRMVTRLTPAELEQWWGLKAPAPKS